MGEIIGNITDAVYDFVWGAPALMLIVGAGLFISLATGFFQLRRFGFSLKTVLGKIFRKDKGKNGGVTPFRALCT
ncbi:MAG: sodium:alanine symporter family protein, partial [Clostridiales bacterium]|nr:sodium:alanine symporter family protein [Candidatus Equinaster intestinalis]